MPKSAHRGACPGNGRSVKKAVRKMAPLSKAAQMPKSGHRGVWPGNDRSVIESVKGMAPVGKPGQVPNLARAAPCAEM